MRTPSWKWAELRDSLLAISGPGSEVNFGLGPDMNALLDKGGLWYGPVELLGAEQQPYCHELAAEAYIAGWVDAIGTGYALTEGTWWQHSWGFWKDTLIELTGLEREAYYGIKLTKAKSKKRALEQLGRV